MIKPVEIELFQNLSQYEFGGNFYDFHNDYDCCKILFKNREELTLVFEDLKDSRLVFLKFKDVELHKFDFFNSPNVDTLTIDNLYRGRFKVQDHLEELTQQDKGYFYLEFDEGQKMEFWSSGITVVIPG